MQLRRYHAARALGVAFLVTSLYLLRRDAGLGTTVEQAALVGSLLAAGVSLGYDQYRRDAASEDDDRPFFDSPAVYVGFWALHWMLFALTLGSLGQTAVGSPTNTVISPVASGVLLVVAWLVAIQRGGVDDSFDPRHWLSEYRDGKRSASGE